MLEIKAITQWNSEFFYQFCSFRNRLYSEGLIESVDDFSKVFSERSSFSKDNFWKAYLVFDGEGRPCTRLIASCLKAEPSQLNIGYFESINNTSPALTLFEEATLWGSTQGAKVVKAPVQGNFYHSYRIQLDGPKDNHYGAPIYKEYYKELFTDFGLKRCRTWTTFRGELLPCLNNAQKNEQFFLSKTEYQYSKIIIRKVNLKRWDKELELIYELFNDSYSNMPEFTSISLEEFSQIYGDFKYFINEDFAFIAEYEGKAIGHLICFFDPLSILLKAQRESASASTLKKVWVRLKTLYKLNRNTGQLLMVYVGKTQDAEKMGVKGVQVKLEIEALKALKSSGSKQGPLYCYFDEGSPALKNLNAKLFKVHSRYGLYEKEL